MTLSNGVACVYLSVSVGLWAHLHVHACACAGMLKLKRVCVCGGVGQRRSEKIKPPTWETLFVPDLM
jgi:hypothetical protein